MPIQGVSPPHLEEPAMSRVFRIALIAAPILAIAAPLKFF